MVSQPFSDYGGPIVSCPQAVDVLYDKAVELALDLNCRYIEFRNLHPMPQQMVLRTDKACMILELASDPQEVWARLRPQIRNRIRRAQNSDIGVKNGGLELLDDFYNLWTLRMGQLGTPCYPRRLFEAILRTFPQSSTIFLATHKGKTVAAMFAYLSNSSAHTRWGASLREYDSLSPNHLLNWAAIEFYCKAGARRFDFGRSTIGSSQYTFKERWGARPINLNWQYWCSDPRYLRVIRPDAPGYRWKVEVWKRLPLTITRSVGPWISRALV
jgi:FemAB-related protein (PEP-CTERM system-associated)